MLCIKVIVGKDTMNTISAYVPQIGLESHLKKSLRLYGGVFFFELKYGWVDSMHNTNGEKFC